MCYDVVKWMYHRVLCSVPWEGTREAAERDVLTYVHKFPAANRHLNRLKQYSNI